MGCGASTAAIEPPVNEPLQEDKEEQEEEAHDGLTKRQKDLIRSTWAEFTQEDYIRDATYIFVILFSEQPKTQELFAFVTEQSEEQLLENERLRKHVGRVVNALSAAVNNLHDLEAVGERTEHLGFRHYRYGAREENLEGIAHGVLHALKRKLGEEFTEEAEKAWEALLAIISTNFAEGS
nr:hypothetical protein BaRGS_010371 [Batillaria attramentaria]